MKKFEIEFHRHGDRGRAALGKKVIEAGSESAAYEIAESLAQKRKAYDFDVFPVEPQTTTEGK